MNGIRDFGGEIDKAECGDEPHFLTWLASNPGKLDELAAFPRYVGEGLNLRIQRVGLRGRGQFGREEQPGHAHGLIDKNLLLIPVPLTPFQNIFKHHDRGLEREDGLKKKGEFQRRHPAASGMRRRRLLRWLSIQDGIMADLHHGERRHRPVRLGVF